MESLWEKINEQILILLTLMGLYYRQCYTIASDKQENRVSVGEREILHGCYFPGGEGIVGSRGNDGMNTGFLSDVKIKIKKRILILLLAVPVVENLDHLHPFDEATLISEANDFPHSFRTAIEINQSINRNLAFNRDTGDIPINQIYNNLKLNDSNNVFFSSV